jgi:hypothetical protein
MAIVVEGRGLIAVFGSFRGGGVGSLEDGSRRISEGRFW